MFGFSFHKKRTPKKRTTTAPPDFGVSAIQRAQVLQQQLNKYQNQAANYHYQRQVLQQGQQQQHGSLLQQYATAGPAYGTTFKQSSVSMAYGVSEKEPVEFKKKEDTKKLLTDILTDKLRNAKR